MRWGNSNLAAISNLARNPAKLVLHDNNHIASTKRSETTMAPVAANGVDLHFFFFSFRLDAFLRTVFLVASLLISDRDEIFFAADTLDGVISNIETTKTTIVLVAFCVLAMI